MEVSKEKFRFEASHVLPNHPGKCSNLHGHSWEFHIAIEDEISKATGMVMDYAIIKEKVQPIIDELDHAHLGAWQTDKVTISRGKTKEVKWLPANFNPTSENLLLAIGCALIIRGIKFSHILLKETDTTSCYAEWDEVRDYYFNSYIDSMDQLQEVK